ncbi:MULTISPECIES: MgtC/SapB family protein [unclassified Hahella]|uniref:MgtC/SapB family protein n=1 Tax=unclassified Hahella TaxID=2624107 RepID=UPI001C1E9149|nr:MULTISPECIES: MgtC/SapB family protein [unclassified Hahella]MBU6954070.1 MgtC/SapB family protein [Hahella sp. HN01]MDG9668849.1 MgtC/SapB family protein [Hahella sp. CR1]
MESFITEYQGQLWVLMHVCIALVLGGAIGFEREMKKRPAGFRTHMLVAATAALFTDLATLLTSSIDANLTSTINADPTRVIVAIATGISFLGAGTIFRSEDGVTGLTTAATLLMASALGVAAALEQYVLAVGLTIIVLIVLRTLGCISNRWTDNGDKR